MNVALSSAERRNVAVATASRLDLLIGCIDAVHTATRRARTEAVSETSEQLLWDAVEEARGRVLAAVMEPGMERFLRLIRDTSGDSAGGRP